MRSCDWSRVIIARVHRDHYLHCIGFVRVATPDGPYAGVAGQGREEVSRVRGPGTNGGNVSRESAVTALRRGSRAAVSCSPSGYHTCSCRCCSDDVVVVDDVRGFWYEDYTSQ
jgi:hypothetical protein